jgi:hypothetical protein
MRTPLIVSMFSNSIVAFYCVETGSSGMKEMPNREIAEQFLHCRQPVVLD